jgi:hypothetical protein
MSKLFTPLQSDRMNSLITGYSRDDASALETTRLAP